MKGGTKNMSDNKKIKTLGGMNQRPGGGKSLNSRPTQNPAGRQVAKPASRPVSNPTMGNKPKAPLQRNVPPKKPAQTQQSVAQHALYNGASVDNGVSGLVKVLRNMVGGFAILSDETIANNVKLAAGGMSLDDRTISFECADYLISNLAYIFMGLVLDKDFKEAFVQAVTVEIDLDKQPADVVANTRKTMKDPKGYKSVGNIIIGVSEFSAEIAKNFNAKMEQGFKSLDAYADEFDAAVNVLDETQKLQYGFIFSNFMYLVRAFTHNDVFMSYVVTVIENVKATLFPQK